MRNYFSSRHICFIRCFRVMAGLLLLLFAIQTAWAQQDEPMVRVELGIDRDKAYQYETFLLTVTMVSSGVRLDKDLTLDGMPDADTLAMGPLEALPIERDIQGRSIIETRRYHARCRALKPGILRLSPAAGATQIVQQRSFFGRQWVKTPIRLPITPIAIPVLQLPSPPNGIQPSGAVGVFSFVVTPAPLDVAVGDLIKLHIAISGDGYLDTVNAPSMETAATGFKVYPPRIVAKQDNAITFEQALIPLNNNVTEIPALRFTYFNPHSESYQTQTQGPFRVTFHQQRAIDQPQPYRSAGSETHPTPALTLAERIDAWKQPPPIKGQETVIVIEPTLARLAPANVAKPLFQCKPGDIVVVNEEHGQWLSIQRKDDMGWIPANAVMRR